MTKFLFLSITMMLCSIGGAQTLQEEVYSDPVAVAQKLIDAYKSGNKKPFDYFFQSWHEWSAQVDSVEQDSKTKFIDSIFQMVYFPFDFKKYGWKNRKINKRYKYAVLPTTFSVCFKDSICTDSLSTLDFCENNLERLKFYSTIKVKGKQILYDNIYYASVLRMFLDEDLFEKSLFSETWVRQPHFRQPENLVTEPLVKRIQIEKSGTKALAYLSLYSTEFFVLLTKSNGQWTREVLPVQIIND